jgi:hypothetical protein
MFSRLIHEPSSQLLLALTRLFQSVLQFLHGGLCRPGGAAAYL